MAASIHALVLFLCGVLAQSPPSSRFGSLYDNPESGIQQSDPHHYDDFYKFVTRPDIDAPRWNVTVYDEKAIAPGYWFMATYEFVVQDDGDNRSFVGPYIYDRSGGLIWSGGPQFAGYNVKDFKVSSIDGIPMLTGIFLKKGVNVVLTNRYELHKAVPVEEGSFVNIHHFDIVDHGTRSLAMTQTIAWTSDQEAIAMGCECDVVYPGLEERDTRTWELTFSWTAHGHIPPNESYVAPECGGICDPLHANSVDKFPDGDYLLSARHSDTLYKISRKDGSIPWRFGGPYSDFHLGDIRFSGQHDARVRSQNETCTVISFLDNAIRPGANGLTNTRSRGLIVALYTNDMTSQVIREYDHPHHSYANGRGNFQVLENGNAFLGWWMHSLISEHSPNGALLAEANWKPELKSYRSYKFDWIGLPAEPPDVYAEAAYSEESIDTFVYVSWNGATEVGFWILYTIDAAGHDRRQITQVERTGFETIMRFKGVASHVIVEAVDRRMESLGWSRVVEVIDPTDTRSPGHLWHVMGFRGAVDFAACLGGASGCVIALLVLRMALCSRKWRAAVGRRLRLR